MSKIERATDLLFSAEDADCFPMPLLKREHFTIKELENMLDIRYMKFKSRHSSLRLGPIQYQRAILGCLERMERDMSPETFEEINYRQRTTSPLTELLFSGFKRLFPFVKKQNQ